MVNLYGAQNKVDSEAQDRNLAPGIDDIKT